MMSPRHGRRSGLRALRNAVSLMLALALLGGCVDEGPAEEAGEGIDRAAEETRDFGEETADEIGDAAEETREEIDDGFDDR